MFDGCISIHELILVGWHAFKMQKINGNINIVLHHIVDAVLADRGIIFQSHFLSSEINIILSLRPET